MMHSWLSRQSKAGAAIASLLAIVLTLAAAWFNGQTIDEGYHVAAGMEWLDRGTYTYESLHPPIGRAIVAAGPYVLGRRSTMDSSFFNEGNRILYGDGSGASHQLTLFAARLGVLPFFVLLLASTFVLARHAFDAPTAVLTTFVLATIPAITGLAAIAITDAPMLGVFSLALVVLTVYLERPSWLSALALAGVAALGSLTKFSFIPFFGVTLVAATSAWLIRAWHDPVQRRYLAREAGQRALHAICAVPVSLLLIWAGYRFHVGPLLEGSAPRAVIEGALMKLVGTQGILHDLAFLVASSEWFPARELVLGIGSVAEEATIGRMAYLFGEAKFGGWWYYFPVKLLAKIGLPTLMLAAIGSIAAAHRFRRAWSWSLFLLLVSGVLVMVTSMPSRIQISFRHVLPCLLPIAVLAGAGASRWLASERSWQRVAASALLGWQLIEGLLALPDPLSFSNPVAQFLPGQVHGGGDIDWGQDVARLGATIDRLGIDTLNLRVFGSALLERHSRATVRRFRADERPTGWVAVSRVLLEAAEVSELAWLRTVPDQRAVGASIILLRVPKSDRVLEPSP